RASGDRALTAGILANLAGDHAAHGHLDRAQSLIEEAVELSRTVGSRYVFSMILFKAGQIAYSVGDLDIALGRFEESQKIGATTGNQRVENIARDMKGFVVLHTGRIEEAQRLLEESVRQWEEWDPEISANLARSWLAELALRRGDLDEAERLLRLLVAFNVHDAYLLGQSRLALAEVLLEKGDLGGAQSVLDRTDGHEPSVYQNEARLIRGRARLAAKRGNRDEALALTRSMLATTATTVAGRLHERLAYGLVLLDLGDYADAERELSQLADEASGLGFVYFEMTARELAMKAKQEAVL
ncbi:MAG: tetratricopeptide repeat protein, partial [Acidobacteriota bacterium]